MKIDTVTPREYGMMFPRPPHIFNSVAFSEHNRHKCDGRDVRYLFAGDSKVRGGIILGRRDGMLHSPFSAPFGGLTVNRSQRFEAVDGMWSDIVEYCRAEGLGLRVTLPPELYAPELTVKSVSALSRLGLTPTLDVSYHLDLTRGNFRDGISRSCRKLLNQASGNGLSVTRVAPVPENILRVYNIIRTNHLSKGRPMWMEADDVISTAMLVKADFFLLVHEGVDIAGAMVYPAADGVAQVVYWGDMPGFGELRAMNLLAEYVYEYYRRAGMRLLDLGPATETGVPNYGLCVFKESLGAEPGLKYTMMLKG